MGQNLDFFSSTAGCITLIAIIVIGAFAMFIKGHDEQEDTTNEDEKNA
ncbi:MAG: hypothetical protein PHE89_08230 [Alphaproteobacteria bacterium]|nr:hypothetical protein [Alphaproteobacteria bacterium]